MVSRRVVTARCARIRGSITVTAAEVPALTESCSPAALTCRACLRGCVGVWSLRFDQGDPTDSQHVKRHRCPQLSQAWSVQCCCTRLLHPG